MHSSTSGGGELVTTDNPGAEVYTSAMSKITKIEIEGAHRSIESGFNLELGDITVIAGENNSGKTNFMRVVAGETKAKSKFFSDTTEVNDVVVHYIPAEVIVGDSEIGTAKKSLVFSALKGFVSDKTIFSIKKDKESELNEDIEALTDIVNAVDAKLININKGTSIRTTIEEEVPMGTILENLISFVPLDFVGGKTHKKFEELGQGMQRLVIVTFLLVMAEKQPDKRNHIVLIEEPEAYLHPKLKIEVNRMLKELVANNERYQVVLTTHDPYFAYTNLNDDDIKNKSNNVYTFERTGEFTKPLAGKVLGIENEMLHIFLFEKLLVEASKVGKIGMGANDPKGLNDYLKNVQKKVTMEVRNYIYPPKKGTPEDLALPLYVRNQIHHPDNKLNKKYDPITDLVKSIELMTSILG